MITRLSAILIVSALSLCAFAKHYSFVGGYPASGVTADRAKAVERGGATVGATATKQTQKTTVVSETKKLTGKVSKVSDGDTIWVETKGGSRSKVRLDRIDAPESDQAFGKKSAEFLSGLILGKEVEIHYTKKDQFGRILGIVFMKNGDNLVDVNLTMVLNGMAWHYAYFDKTPCYIKAQEAAKASKLGLWASPNPINPYEWRKRKHAK